MRPCLLLLSAFIVAGCGGHSGAPAGAATPAARPAPAAESNTIRYAPGTARYRYEQSQHATQEVMGQVTSTDATTNMLVSSQFTAADAGNIGAVFTVDSITVTTAATAAAAGAAAAADMLRGKTFRSVFTAQGRPVSFTPPDTTAASALSGDMFKEFLPTLPAGPVSAGTTWIDTINAPPTVTQGMTIRTVSIRTHRVVGWESRDGVRALHIATTGNYTLSGEGEQGGSPLTLTGTGTATSDRFVSATGMYIGATSNDTANVQVTVVSMGLEVPVHQGRHTTLTRLP